MGKISVKFGKKLATNALKNPHRFLEIGANVATAASSRNPEAALLTLPEAINWYHTGKGLYLIKFEKILLYKWNKNRLYPSAPLEKDYLEQRLQKNIK